MPLSTNQRSTIALPISSEKAVQIARRVVSPPNKAPTAALVHDLFGEDYVPGTFILAERKDSPAFLRDEQEESYEGWIRAMTRSHLEALVRAELLQVPMDAW